MKIPTNLDAEAKAFWKRHAKHCKDNGSLTPETLDSFVLVCRIHSMLQGCDPTRDSKEAMRFSGLMKYFATYAKPFGLLGSKPPAEKKGKSIGEVIRDALGGSSAQ